MFMGVRGKHAVTVMIPLGDPFMNQVIQCCVITGEHSCVIVEKSNKRTQK
jgi:hypothetical protein